MMEVPVFLRFALREMRGGLHGFYIFLCCLAVGVAAIAGAGSLNSALVAGMRGEGQSILGGDVALELNYRDADTGEMEFMRASGDVSLSRDMRVMVRNNTSGIRTLAELKAVDTAYPLFGSIALREPQNLQDILAQQNGVWGVAIEAPLAIRLGAEIGTLLKIGALEYQLRGIILREPDRASGGLALGPRAMVAMDSLPATQLVQPGSLQVRHYRIRLAPDTDLQAWTDTLNRKFPDSAWRVRDRDNSAPTIRQFLQQMTLFLTLTGLTALVVGGVGAGNAVRGYLQRKRTAIATLKCVGASGAFIFRTYMAQIFLLALLGIAIGLCVGAAIPFLLEHILAELLPVPAYFAIYPMPLLYAAAFGLATAVAFAIWPLARAREISAAALFRDLVTPVRRWPRPAYIAATAAAVAVLTGLAFLIAGDTRFAAWFVVGVAVSFATLRLLAGGIMQAARTLPRPRRPELRMAVANMHRPGTPAPVVFLSLGLGLTLLVVIAQVEGNVANQVNDRARHLAPAFFFLDIPAAEVENFSQLAQSIDGVSKVETFPTLRGRITHLKGTAATAESVPPEARWALRGDRVLSYSATAPANAVLGSGQWWPPDYTGPQLLSLDAQLAESMGLSLGDTVTVNVLGREIEATIANTRRIDWSTLGVNFALVFSPGLLSKAPHAYLGTARATEPAEEVLHKAITDRFSSVSAVRVRETLEAVNSLLNNLGIAIRSAGGVTLVSGILVLAGALAAGHGQRVYDAVVLKVLGASRARILGAFVAEYALLGLLAAIPASIIGTLASYLVVTELMHADYKFLPLSLVITLGGSTFVTILLGLATTWRVLGQKAAAVLRTAG